jgi:ubiquinone/menaquinone biosynthesis C-methylase UbiE
MLHRVLEAEVMDGPDEAADYDAMDHAQVNQQFVTDFLAVASEVDELLDVGTGTARIPIELCRASPEARVYAIDLATSMLDVARINLELAGMTDRIMLACVDAKAMPFGSGRFSATLSNSILHHIPEPAVVMAESWRVTRSGGLLFFRDLMRPDAAETVDHLVATYTANDSEHARQMFCASLRAALTLDEIRGLVADLGLEPETVQPTSDRHWTWIATKPQA